MRVGYNSNDWDLFGVRTQNAQDDVGVQGISAGEIAFGESGIDDKEIGVVLDVFLVKDSAALKGHAEGLKEAGTDVTDLRRWKRPWRRWEGAFNEKPRHDLRGPEGNNGCGGGGKNARRLRDAIEKLLVEVIGGGAVVAVLWLGQGDFSREQMVGTKAWVDGQELLKAAHDKRA